MKQILCYGDSNTWGHDPDWAEGKELRYPYEVRWPGCLEGLLGTEYRVISEGLCARSTSYDDPVDVGKNGLACYPVCYESAMPVEWVVLMLGTNDVRPVFHAPPQEIVRGMERLGILTERISRECGQITPKILIIAPVPVAETAEEGDLAGIYDRTSVQKSRELAALYKTMAKRHGWEFLDANTCAPQLGKDGVHLTADGHRRLAEAVCNIIKG